MFVSNIFLFLSTSLNARNFNFARNYFVQLDFTAIDFTQLNFAQKTDRNHNGLLCLKALIIRLQVLIANRYQEGFKDSRRIFL